MSVRVGGKSVTRDRETDEIITYGEHTDLPLSAVVALARRRDGHSIIPEKLDQCHTAEGKKRLRTKRYLLWG